MARLKEERWPRMAIAMVPESRRPVGRPKRRWMDGLRKDLTTECMEEFERDCRGQEGIEGISYAIARSAGPDRVK